MKRIVVLVSITVGALGLVAGPVAASARTQPSTLRATSAQQAANLALGKRLVTRFWTLLTGDSATDLGAFLSPAFQVQRANGTGANRNQCLAQFGKATKVSAFKLSDYKVTRSGTTLVARYISATTETILGESYAKAPAPRLSTFIWTGSTWKLLSHANFNAPS